MKFTDNALITVRAIDPPADVHEFVQAADMYLPPPEGTTTSSADRTAATVDGTASKEASALAAHSQTEAAAEALAKETPQVAFLQPPPARDPYALARVYAHEIEKEVRPNSTHPRFRFVASICAFSLLSFCFFRAFLDEDKTVKSFRASLRSPDLARGRAGLRGGAGVSVTSVLLSRLVSASASACSRDWGKGC